MKMDIKKNTDYEIDITKDQDRGVLKSIIKEGSGSETPSSGYLVTIHYIGTYLNGEKFDSSKDRNIPISFYLGQDIVIKAWDICVATMKKDEVCQITCAPEYTHGFKGSQNTKPNTVLKFEIELLDWKSDVLKPVKSKGIFCHILEKGEGQESPEEGDIVTVELKGRTVAGSKLFDARSVTFTLGEGSAENICEGIEKALIKFQKGETSLLIIQPKYAFKTTGNFALGVPPNSIIEYVVKLVNIEKDKDPSLMNGKEKIEKGKTLNEKGLLHYKRNKLQFAFKTFKKVISLVEDLVDSKEPVEYQAQAKDLLLSAHLYLSILYLKTSPALSFEASCFHASKYSFVKKLFCFCIFRCADNQL